MAKRWLAGCLMAIALVVAPNAHAVESLVGPTGVLKLDPAKAYMGYTLFSPMVKSKTTYLIDMEGNVVHTWTHQHRPGLHSQLLPNGNLLIALNVEQKEVSFGGVGGLLQELDWNGKVVWEYRLASKDQVQHHTFHRMPNGNTLILAWERKTKEEALAKGRDPKTIPDHPVKYYDVEHNDFWSDFVIEVDRQGKTVWEWHAWDHIGTGPNQLDINYRLPEPVGTVYPNFDWSHFNTVGYNPQTDQVILNSRNFAEFYFINHKTGAIEYRWGNPSTHGAGKAPGWYDNGDQKVFGSHHSSLLDNGNILLFDNGSERPEGNRSAVLEIDPKTSQVVWQYTAKDSNSFYTYRQGGAQRLPNGNTLVISTHHGHLFEVTPDKKVVWDFVNPVAGGQVKCLLDDDVDCPQPKFMTNMIHRAYRYGPDFPGLKGKDLSKKTPLAPGCPQFYKIYTPGMNATAATAPAAAPAQAAPAKKAEPAPKAAAPAPKPAAQDDDGPTMKAY